MKDGYPLRASTHTCLWRRQGEIPLSDHLSFEQAGQLTSLTSLSYLAILISSRGRSAGCPARPARPQTSTIFTSLDIIQRNKSYTRHVSRHQSCPRGSTSFREAKVRCGRGSTAQCRRFGWTGAVSRLTEVSTRRSGGDVASNARSDHRSSRSSVTRSTRIGCNGAAWRTIAACITTSSRGLGQCPNRGHSE